MTIGRVGKPHGIEGAFVVEDASDAPERFAIGAALHVAGERAEIVESKRADSKVSLSSSASSSTTACVSWRPCGVSAITRCSGIPP